jgi:hypothetical protein
MLCDVQVAGYVVDYDSGLSYATVKGAGRWLQHMAMPAGLAAAHTAQASVGLIQVAVQVCVGVAGSCSLATWPSANSGRHA